MSHHLTREQAPERGDYLSYLDGPHDCGPVDVAAIRAAMSTGAAPGQKANVRPAHERRSIRIRLVDALTGPKGGMRKWM